MPFGNCPEQERAPELAGTGDFGSGSGAGKGWRGRVGGVVLEVKSEKFSSETNVKLRSLEISGVTVARNDR